ncbi:hypothetical protein R9C00_02840 [Flammeovirgaceae bacterium SG7u.111]|nr:hypothetical protein [Flammeovirgaceae bacterium SG7u.132]WPO36377.1 hypothetical protein R9C00_02840 [Flammeovirgaceae bacterium SG7u.111]
MIRKNIVIISLVLWGSVSVLAQGANSPYSILGLGHLQHMGNIANNGMGGIGVSNSHALQSNTLNPANLVSNKIVYFDASMMGEFRQTERGDSKQTDFGGNLMHLSFGFPVTRNWTMGFGLRPVTLVNYEISTYEKLPNTPTFVEYEYLGDGGITQAYFSNGIMLVKGLSVGLEATYNFGSINRQTRSNLDDGSNEYTVGIFNRRSFSQITFLPGIRYAAQVGEKFFVNLGGTYKMSTEYAVRDFEAIERRSASSDARIVSDTLMDVRSKVKMPSALNMGVSIEIPYKFVFGVDVSLQKWTDFTETDGANPYKDAMEVRSGLEWTPDYTSVSSYLKRVSYRIGGAYKELPYEWNDKVLNDYSASMGMSFPMGRGYSTLNLALIYGVLGNGDNTSIKEQYARFNFGLTINDPNWFIRRRIN